MTNTTNNQHEYGYILIYDDALKDIYKPLLSTDEMYDFETDSWCPCYYHEKFITKVESDSKEYDYIYRRQINVGNDYILVPEGEKLQDGDQIYFIYDKEWVPMNSIDNGTKITNDFPPVRRLK